MKLKHILLIILLILLVVATGATLIGEFKEMVTEPKGNASVVVTGDVMFARNMPAVLDFDSSPFRGVTDVVSTADLLLINFENAATSSEDAVKGDVPLKCDPSYVPLAKANNNTVAALANNHACDYGISGMRDTISNLKDAGITPMGAGETEADAHKAYTEVINGRKITVLNYMDSNDFSEYSYDVMPYANGSSPGYSAYSSQDAQKQISEHNDSDLIVAYLHFGNEYSHSPNEDQVKMAHELIDYGADVVIGSHPHVTQGIEMYKDRPIFYSLGNFIFDQSNEDTHTAYFVQLNLVNDTCNCNVYPIHISNYLPIHMGTEDGYNLLSGLTPNCEELDITNGVGRLNFTLSDK
ncbi:metallophosphatase [Methanobrevibacter sp. YE315]|uniref:CapA family protein n=1 Tax=Methanobrevibacter sp. YE315 TaxID=1609968 RepID=UPI000764E86D|nr:CapA family protein [Methanobrevibacter sp. YE315]AMD16772.1 metallophosphatase [Methanobrevibacter sp. YE315]